MSKEILTVNLDAAIDELWATANQIADQRSALLKALRDISDRVLVASHRLRAGYVHLHPGIPVFCDSFDRLAKEAKDAIARLRAGA